jgi:hypothetical protein
MSVVSSIFNGLAGSAEVHPHSLIPGTGFTCKTEANKKPMIIQDYTKAPILFNNSLDYSTRRAVLPCKGITHHVLRRPALPSAGGMVAPTGIGRHQAKGLAFSPEKPIDGPIMPLSNPFAPGLNNMLGQPP